jgi:hypothetical protein
VLRVPFSSGQPGTWRTDQTRPALGIWSSKGAEPEVQLSTLAECADDQGATFRLWQPADRPKR